jgi:uncharacterized protein with GYD domain
MNARGSVKRRQKMPGYVVLAKFTQQGMTNIKEVPRLVTEGKAQAEKLGIRVIGVWTTFGEYDQVMVCDAPNDQSIATLVMAVASQGNVTTQTMRGLSEEELAQVVGKIP